MTMSLLKNHNNVKLGKFYILEMYDMLLFFHVIKCILSIVNVCVNTSGWYPFFFLLDMHEI